MGQPTHAGRGRMGRLCGRWNGNATISRAEYLAVGPLDHLPRAVRLDRNRPFLVSVRLRFTMERGCGVCRFSAVASPQLAPGTPGPHHNSTHRHKVVCDAREFVL